MGDMGEGKTAVGFIGLGIMGSRMAANLARAGFPLFACTRTEEKGRSWASEHRVEYEHDPTALAARCDIVITMVVDGAQVESILLDERFVDSLRPGALCIDMSTIGPGTSQKIGERLGERGIGFMDAPVSGSSPRAEDATLTIMAGGSPDLFERARPVFESMGKLVVNVGPVGHGSMVKLINNTLAAANAVAAGEALVLAKSLGLDLDAAVEVWSSGSGGSAMLDLKAGPMREHDYTTLFKLEHMLKDVRLCMQQAQRAGIGFASGEHARDALTDAHDRGFTSDDFAAVIEAIEAAADVKL